MQVRQLDPSVVQSVIASWLQKKMPKARDISITNIERSGSGMSNETFLFDVSWREGKKSRSEGMVLRLPPKAHPVHPEYDLKKQFTIMQSLAKTNVPVPKMYWMEEDTEVLGAPFYIMGKLNGIVPLDYPPYHSFGVYFNATPLQRAKMWWGSLDAMAKVHKVDWEKLGLSFLGAPKGGTHPVDRRLDYLERFLNWIKEGPQDTQPMLETALKWLRQNRYVPERVGLCWGDTRLPNTMYDQNFDVIAVLDWEMAYLGDPESDLAWFLLADWQHSEGYGIPRLEGSPSREETIKRYEELTGFKVKNLFYNEVLNAFYYAIVTAKVFKNLKKMGISQPGDATEYNTPSHQRLASLLNLPAPAAPRKIVKLEEITATLQFHLTGPKGGDWYLIYDKGRVTRHGGTVVNPTCTLIASAEDWAAIQSGEMVRFQAWTSGKLKIEGDMTLFLQLEETISKFTRGGQ